MFPTPQEVAEVVDYVFNVEKFGYTLQITGGTRRDFDVEAGYAKKLLATIDEVIGLRNIPGEVIIYISPPKDPPAIDQLFEAGATRVSLDLEAWDREAFQRVCPGKTPFFDREVALRAQDYIVETYGPWKAYSSFVVGAEPLTTLMAGADYIASRGVVPIMPVVNHQNPMLAGMDARPRLDYYRATYEGYMEIFAKYDVPQPNKGRCGCCVCGE
jgi:hypothetical protein